MWENYILRTFLNRATIPFLALCAYVIALALGLYFNVSLLAFFAALAAVVTVAYIFLLASCNCAEINEHGEPYIFISGSEQDLFELRSALRRVSLYWSKDTKYSKKTIKKLLSSLDIYVTSTVMERPVRYNKLTKTLTVQSTHLDSQILIAYLNYHISRELLPNVSDELRKKIFKRQGILC